jgi:hypothetical protein
MDSDMTGLPEINDALLGDVKKLVDDINVKSPWHRSKLDIKLEDGVILILKDSKLGLKAQNRIRLIPHPDGLQVEECVRCKKDYSRHADWVPRQFFTRIEDSVISDDNTLFAWLERTILHWYGMSTHTFHQGLKDRVNS